MPVHTTHLQTCEKKSTEVAVVRGRSHKAEPVLDMEAITGFLKI